MRGQSRRKRKREWVHDCNDVGLLFFLFFVFLGKRMGWSNIRFAV